MKAEPWMAIDPPYPVNMNEEDRAWLASVQPFLRDAAGQMGNYHFCRLAKCRRAKNCLGEHPPERYHENFYNRFPPCVACGAGQSRLMGAIRELVRSLPPEAFDETDET